MRACQRDLPLAKVAWSGDMRRHRGGSAGRGHQRSALGKAASASDRAVRVAV